MNSFLGIDVGKQDCYATLWDGQRYANKVFPNSSKGFDALLGWLRNRKVTHVHVCMEATGAYYEPLAFFLLEAGHLVSVVNPSRIKAFGQSELSRTKTDKVDAALIARFAAMQIPEAWQPPPPEIRTLQALLRRLDTLDEMRLQEENRLEAPLLSGHVRASILEVVTALQQQVQAIEAEIKQLFHDHPDLQQKQQLLISVPGIGAKTAARILAELPDVEHFRNSRAVAAYAGLCPAERQSGLMRGRTRLSKVGNARLRRYMYMPAVVAMRHNQGFIAFAQRMLDRGKAKMVILGAIMRKLLTLAYAILRSGKPYNSALSMAR